MTEDTRLKDWKGEPIETPECQNCKSHRVVTVKNVYCEDQVIVLGSCVLSNTDEVLPWRGESMVLDFDLCIECGQVQGEWPKPKTQLEYKLEEIPF
jgi:Zn ribbon nucleic-acid-binding protein